MTAQENRPVQWPGLRKTAAPIDYVFTTTPDQSRTIIDFLKERGLHVESFEGSPAFRETYSHEVRQALQLVFDHRLPGWWNLRLAYLRKGICTKEEFDAAHAG